MKRVRVAIWSDPATERARLAAFVPGLRGQIIVAGPSLSVVSALLENELDSRYGEDWELAVLVNLGRVTIDGPLGLAKALFAERLAA